MAKKGEELDFKVIEFVKETKRIILSHSRTFEEGARTSQSLSQLTSVVVTVVARTRLQLSTT